MLKECTKLHEALVFFHIFFYILRLWLLQCCRHFCADSRNTHHSSYGRSLPLTEKSCAVHLSNHHKCKPSRKFALFSNSGKRVFKKSIEKETSLTTGFSKWCELFIGIVQAFSLRSLFVFIKLILYKRAFEACDLHFAIFKKLEKKE